MFDVIPTRAVERRLTTVLDCLASPPVAVDAATLLNALSAADVATLRREITNGHADSTDLFRCVVCDGPLFLTTEALTFGLTGGARTFFKHHAGRNCPLTDTSGRHPDEIDARRFDGRQEGKRHHALKHRLAAMLRADPAFCEVAVERKVRTEGGWRRPDVQAMLGGTRFVFEVQLARLQLPRMIERERAYDLVGVRLVWVVDGDRLVDDIWWQSHQDMLAGQGGRLVAIGDAQLAGEACCGLVTVEERDGGFELDRRTMGLAEAVDLVAPSDPADRAPLSLDRYSRVLFVALRSADRERVDNALADLCDRLGLEATAKEAWRASVPEALAALGTLLTGRKFDASGFGETDAAAILNNFLHAPRRRPWAPLLAEAAQVSPCAAVRLARGSTARKLAEALADPTDAEDRIDHWRPLFEHLFPVLRPRRLASAGRPA